MQWNIKSITRIAIISLFGVIIIGYAIFQAQKLLRGPIIDIYSPQNGTTFNEALIEIEGKARNVAYLSLNDRPIFTDKSGYFNEKMLLSPGYNVIKLDASDKFKKRTEKILQIILKEQ